MRQRDSVLAGAPAQLGDFSGRPGPGQQLLRFVRRYPRITAFALLLIAVWAISFSAPLLAPFNPNAVNTFNLTATPSWAHPLGTDDLGRDVLSRVLYGGRLSMIVALVVVLISSSIGITAGLIGGYFGGLTDQLIGRLVDAVLAFPGLLLILAAVATFGQNLRNVALIIGLISWPRYYRLTRGQVLQAREFEYITAARSVGVRSWRLLWRHVLPNISNPLIVVTSLAAGSAILLEANVSFLGVGAQPPEAEWGSMFFQALGDFRVHPWLIFGPGAAVFITVLAYYMLGDALRDALDPKLRGRRAGFQLPVEWWRRCG